MNLDFRNIESQLDSEDLYISGFANVVNGMREQQFSPYKELIQKTAHRLFIALIQNDSDRKKLLGSFFLEVLKSESLANVKTKY